MDAIFLFTHFKYVVTNLILNYKNHNFFRKVLLNNKPLNLINDKKLPDINPEIIINLDGLELELSSGDIGFWIIPDAQVNCNYFACVCIPNLKIDR